MLISGSGSNLQAVLDACHSGAIPADVVAVVSNRADAYGLERAEAAGVTTELVIKRDDEDRAVYDARLAVAVASFAPDWIVLAGWMRLLSMEFLSLFPDRVVNLHPALPGELAGTQAIERAWSESQTGTRTESGVMVHLVPDEGVDDGPVLGTTVVPIDASGTLETFATAIHDAEHALLVDVLTELCSPHLTPDQEGPPS